MNVTVKKVTPLETNCYTVDDGSHAFVVDCGADADDIFADITSRGLTLEAILLTHAHYDHIGGVAKLKQLSGAKIYISKIDAELINSYKNLAFALGGTLEKFTPDVLLNDGDEIEIGSFRIAVLSTPGHTAGGVCYKLKDRIFTGDTIFELSYGRTDFPTGDFSALVSSIEGKLFALKGDYVLYPGHGESTTLAYEKKNNPILFDR